MIDLRAKLLMCAAAVAAPTYAAAQSQDDCDRLLLLIQSNQAAAGIVAEEEARRLQAERNPEACLVALRRLEGQTAQQSQGEQTPQSNIVVEQPAPTVTVDQAAPEITVQQTEPSVTVRQPQPQIIVRQPAPTVTVDIPQPEIILRMPPPQVAVQQAAPQVEVEQAEPRVRVQQPEQPAVQVQESEQAEVQLQGATNQANVEFEAVDQPSVTYERGEANVLVNQPEGEPVVRIERMDAGAAEEARAAQGATQQMQGQPTEAAAVSSEMRSITASEIEGMDVVNLRGVQLGEVENVVRSAADNREFIVISHGGFLGLGEKRVALPLTDVRVNGDRIQVPGLTDEQISALPAFDWNDRTYPEVENESELQITPADQAG
jgi:sporulation protein YlmC with PRC-barrel domain